MSDTGPVVLVKTLNVCYTYFEIAYDIEVGIFLVRFATWYIINEHFKIVEMQNKMSKLWN